MSGSSPIRLTDALAEPPPLGLVLGVLVTPEPVVLGRPIDHRLDSELVEQARLRWRRDHADRRTSTVEDVLHGVAADPTRGAPHEDGVALLHPGPVLADEHAIARRVAQGVDRRLLPRQVRRLGHQLVGLDDREVGEPAEVRLESPDPLVGRQHRVVVAGRVLVVDEVAVDRHSVAWPPVAHRRADPQHDTSGVGSDDVDSPAHGEPPTRFPWPRRSRNPNVGSGSKIDVHTVLKLMLDAITATYASSGASSGVATSPTCSALGGVLVPRRQPFEHRRRRRAGRTRRGSARESAGWRSRQPPRRPRSPPRMCSIQRCYRWVA